MSNLHLSSNTKQSNTDAPLRFITAGSVDDGKSTLIGRLLYDSKALLSDQLDSLVLKNASEAMDFSALTDGLEAEREQGITIDVAYRYFATAKRKFIIADTPGHEQYTRNMVTGASTADAAVLLIDAAQLDFSSGLVQLLPQTKRHSAILSHLRCQHIIVAINKMDLLDFAEDKFIAIVAAYRDLAAQLGLTQVQFVPISALHGDNVVHHSTNMAWYQGLPLLQILQDLPNNQTKTTNKDDFYLPVQYVLRADGSQQDDFRGYQGRVEAGSVAVGDAVRIMPSQQTSTISRLIGVGGDVAVASVGEQLTICLADDVDISRGNVIVADNSAITPTKQITATLCWFDVRPLNLARKYLLKHTTQTLLAKVSHIHHILDVHTLSNIGTQDTFSVNDIGRVTISLQKPILATAYADNIATGSFILIDEATHQTVAAGMVVV
ncbi:sulfate adenylyltransferase subunit 1 [Moraxella cuniculi DSM 21768]|uniref:sulfate adenylyltransferase n=1 Tax=Moraxella cuniculi DSM 21768 TaxID=1122245 RepID=A0A1N7DT18_9GAMM|nr:GTP-binding protein [Moraxella cuniculi]OOS07452.1 sulfate adenylyltransferase [Moraxella cuniculi]SIR78984.1 sulfate adenylyltransferase subunit 1 [Moraxella cuniculi DSM 21768]